MAEHVCLLHVSDEQRLQALFHWIRRGLELGERIAVLPFDPTDRVLRDAIERAAAHAGSAARQPEQLLLLDPDTTPEAAVDLALAPVVGFAGIRVCCEPAALGGGDSIDTAPRAASGRPDRRLDLRVLDALRSALGRLPVLWIHGRSASDPDTLPALVAAHPLLIINNEIHENPRYLPPAASRAPSVEEEFVRRWMDDAEKTTEHLLRESQKIAASGIMAAHIAHEINNPLAGISNSFALICRDFPADHPYAHYVPKIRGELERVAGIVRQMYDLYRPERESNEPTDLLCAIRSVTAILRSAARERQVEIVLGPVNAPFVRASTNPLKQVLLNVIQNAVEASPPGAVVLVTTCAGGGHVQIHVADQGPGIPAAAASRVFEPFFTTKSGLDLRGLGLGLSISRTLIEEMNGTLHFRSRPGGGTVFTIGLPPPGPERIGGDELGQAPDR